MSAVAKTEPTALSPQQQFRHELDRMADQFAMALPSHIKPEKFQRVVMTAVLSDPNILNADRKSLMEAAIRAAQDGLLPDKREAAFVVFNTKVNGQWVKAVQFMPMIGGVIKRIHQSGEVAMITAKVVFGGDSFRSWIDDEGEHLAYEQAELPDYDTIRQVFAMAKMKDGSIYVETLTPRDIEKIRSVSRSKDGGPWTVWWEEMAKKSAIRRLAKRLPLSTEIHDMIARDDALYDLSRAPDPRPSLGDRLAKAKTGSLTDAREGFDRSFIDGELRGSHDAATGEDGISEDDARSRRDALADAKRREADASPQDEGTDEDKTEDKTPTADMGENSPDTLPDRDLSAAADSDISSDIDPDAPASEHEDAITPAPAKLISYTRAMFLVAGGEGDAAKKLDRLEKTQDRWRPELTKLLDADGLKKAQAIFKSAQAVSKDEADLDAAGMHFAEVLGCQVGEILPKGGDANG